MSAHDLGVFAVGIFAGAMAVILVFVVIDGVRRQ